MIAGGELGDVHFIHGAYLQDWLLEATDFSWRLEPDKGGESSAIGDIGSHWCDLVQHVTGRRIVEVLADLTTVIDTRLKPSASTEAFARGADADARAVPRSQRRSRDGPVSLRRRREGQRRRSGRSAPATRTACGSRSTAGRRRCAGSRNGRTSCGSAAATRPTRCSPKDPSLLAPGARALRAPAGRSSGGMGRRVLQRDARRLRFHRQRRAAGRGEAAGLRDLRRRVSFGMRR